MKNWDDARYMLAVANAKTFSAAAKNLNVNQTTVSRRIERLEQELGLSLFVLNEGHLEATDTGAALIEECRKLEPAFARLDQRILSLIDNPVYRVTLAATEIVARTMLAPNIGKLHSSNPNLHLTLITGQLNVRLDQGEADMAVRLKRPGSGRFKVRKLADIEFAVYARKSRKQSKQPQKWLGYTEDMAGLPEAIWMEAYMGGPAPILRTNNAQSLAEAAASGAGVAMLPCQLGDAHSRLQRYDPAIEPVSREAWLVIREGMSKYPHIRAVADWIVDGFSTGLQS
jgi:DNA-binding transcriptional LysR family regulator